MVACLLIYLVYILPKPSNFVPSFLSVFIISVGLNAMFLTGFVIVLLVSLGSLSFFEAIGMSLIVLSTGFVLDLLMLLQSQSFLFKSVLYTSTAGLLGMAS